MSDTSPATFDPTTHIVLPDVDLHTLKVVIRFLYTGKSKEKFRSS